MIENRISKISNKIWIIINQFVISNEIRNTKFTKKVIRKSAIMLTDRRIARIPGRLIFLIVSIQTITGKKTGGVS